MQRLRWFGIFALLSALTCGGLDTFDVRREANAVIPAATVLEELLDATLPFDGFSDINLADSQELENQGVDKNDIDSAKITELTLTITSPDSGDFTFLESLDLFVEAEGEESQRIAHGQNFPAGEKVISLDVDDVDLTPYATSDSMSITTSATGHRPSEETHITAEVAIEVDVNVSGALCGGD